MITPFAWNDSALCWIFFAEAVCCYLYRRYVEEHARYSPRISVLFVSIAFLAYPILLLHLTAETWYGPVTPTVIFFSFWFADLIGTLRRFYPRYCRHCGSQMTVSTFDSSFAELYGEGRLLDHDLWFCSSCAVKKQIIAGKPEFTFCRRCKVETSHENSCTIMIPPRIDTIGAASQRTVCCTCGIVIRKRVLIRPLMRGAIDEIYKKERELVRKLNLVSLSDE